MDKTLSKLKRVEGQISGIRKMYEEGRGCLEVVQQVIAVRSALAGVGRDILQGEAKACSRKESKEDFDKVLKALFDLQ